MAEESEGKTIQKAQDRGRSESTNNMVLLIIVLVIGAILIFLARAPIIYKLSDPAFARGVITFIICIATIALAFLMVYQAFMGQSDDTKFRRAREIFTGLMGVLGTIVGFYFGSAIISADTPEVASLQISGREVISYVAGGASPYRAELAVKGKYADLSKFDIKKEIVSEDGWVRYSFENPVTEASVELSIKDSKNVTASNKGEYKKPDVTGGTVTDVQDNEDESVSQPETQEEGPEQDT